MGDIGLAEGLRSFIGQQLLHLLSILSNLSSPRAVACPMSASAAGKYRCEQVPLEKYAPTITQRYGFSIYGQLYELPDMLL